MRITTSNIRDMKRKGERIVAITAYDFTFARLADRAGVHILLIGDSLGMVVQGHDTTLPVTLDEIIYHSRMVVRGSSSAMVVADMPFMSYQVSVEDALRNTGRVMKEALVNAVKLEGGAEIAPTVRRLVQIGIPVIGHIGLTPQAIHQLGGYKVQGRNPEAARKLIADAEALSEAGAFAIVLETIPAELAQLITERTPAATIGIGAGVGCDGEIQVIHDLLGLVEDLHPRHTKRYAELSQATADALSAYRQEVIERRFPGPDQTFSLKPEVIRVLREELALAEPIRSGKP